MIMRETSNEKLWGYYICAGKVKPRINSLYTELMSLKKEPNESVIDNILRREATLTTLRNATDSLNDGLIIAIVLKGLSDTFNAFFIRVT